MDPSEARNATVIANAMSSIIPGLRDLSSETAPVRNGLPPQKYITVPRMGEIHPMTDSSGNRYPRITANMLLKNTTGTAMTSMIQNSRRNCCT